MSVTTLVMAVAHRSAFNVMLSTTQITVWSLVHCGNLQSDSLSIMSRIRENFCLIKAAFSSASGL